MKRILALLVITLASFNSVLAEEATATTQSAEVTLIHSETSTTETTPAVEVAPAPEAEPQVQATPAADDEWENLDGDESAPADESDEE